MTQNKKEIKASKLEAYMVIHCFLLIKKYGNLPLPFILGNFYGNFECSFYENYPKLFSTHYPKFTFWVVYFLL